MLQLINKYVERMTSKDPTKGDYLDVAFFSLVLIIAGSLGIVLVTTLILITLPYSLYILAGIAAFFFVFWKAYSVR